MRTYANGQKLNTHHGDEKHCESCKKGQWKVCWNLSDDYVEYLEEGMLIPSVWNDFNIDLEDHGLLT